MTRQDNRNAYPFHNQAATAAPRPRFTYTPRKRPTRTARMVAATMGALSSLAALAFTIAR